MAERAKRFQSAVVLFALVLLIFLVTAIALSFLPQDLSDIEGREIESGKPVRNLERVLENATKDNIAVSLSEEEVNQWLSTKIAGTQEGMLASNVSYRGAWVRFKEGSVDLVFEREAFQRQHTISMNVEIDQTLENNRMSSQINWKGGRLGQMPVLQGYLALVMKSYQELAEAMAPEVTALRSLLEGRATVEISEGKIDFVPRSTGDDSDLSDLF